MLPFWRFLSYRSAPTGHESPAAQVATTFTTGAYDNTERVTEFVKSCDVVTYEFENIPAETAQLASTFAPLLPSATCLDVSQDRLTEKTFISTQAQVPVAPFEAVSTLSDVKRVLKTMNGKCVLKTRRFGYDGKGQAVISNETEAEEAWNTLGHVQSDQISKIGKILPQKIKPSSIFMERKRHEMAVKWVTSIVL